MTFTNSHELLLTAKEFFIANQYQSAEPLLNQLILRNNKSPEIFHMLGTIYYDQSKFNKAIRSFKRALELDPTFTDASVGLSIILNDLGRYEEGQQVFTDAKVILDKKKNNEDPYINEKLALKHDELGEMYFRYQRYNEALEQYFKALNLSEDDSKYNFKIAECYIQLNQHQKAIRILTDSIEAHPDDNTARLKLGQLYYDLNQVTSAIEQWEMVLERQPTNPHAQRYLRQAQSVENTRLEL